MNPNKPYCRKAPAIRREEVIEAALKVATRIGAQGLVRDRIAEECGLSSSILHRYFGGMDSLREIVISEAFRRGNIEVLYKSLTIEDFKKLNTQPALTVSMLEYLAG